MLTILFLCTANAVRSQLAEAIVNQYFSDNFKAYSAGTKPSTVATEAIRVLQQRQIASDHLYSKNLQELSLDKFDFIITLCNQAKQECIELPTNMALLHWDIQDPRNGDITSFEEAYQDIQQRISQFCHIQQQAESCLHSDPIELFKLLSDNTRLQIIMLIEDEQRLSVSQLCVALNESQPKVSRHLALLRSSQLLATTRQAQHIYYHLPLSIAPWVKQLIATTRMANPAYINLPLLRLRELRQAIQP